MQKTLLLCVGLVVLASMVLLGCEGEDDSGARSVSTAEADTASTSRPITSHTQVLTVDGPRGTDTAPPSVVISYSAPRLDMEPREGVSIRVSLSGVSVWKTVEANVEIINRSGSSFSLFPHRLKLFVNGARIEHKRSDEKPREYPSREEGGTVTSVDFHEPDDFDPAEAGLVYVPSDPSSAGFTQTGGKVPARYSPSMEGDPFGLGPGNTGDRPGYLTAWPDLSPKELRQRVVDQVEAPIDPDSGQSYVYLPYHLPEGFLPAGAWGGEKLGSHHNPAVDGAFYAAAFSNDETAIRLVVNPELATPSYTTRLPILPESPYLGGRISAGGAGASGVHRS